MTALSEVHAGAPLSLPEEKLPLRRLVPALFLSSVAGVLFSLLIFRLLSFFVMPSMFFALLLVGFPIGAALATLGTGGVVRRFRLLLVVLQVLMILTIVATLLCKHVNYLRAQLLFGVDPNQLLWQILMFALLYLPFFTGYGAAEYVGYLTGTALFGQRMRPVYGLFLFGGAAAFGIAALLQRAVGVPRLLVAAVAVVGLSRALVSRRRFWASALELAGLVALASWPGFDRQFMDWFKGSASSVNSAANYLARFPGSESVYAAWGKYSYLEVLRLPGQDRPYYVGLYNDISMWVFPPLGHFGKNVGPVDVSAWPPQDRLPLRLLPREHGRVAIIGAGGGREVRASQLAGAERILALELEPQIVHAVRGPLREEFAEVFSKPPLEMVVGDARSYFENLEERFDLIMLMSVGSYPQLMLEPGNMIRTVEAYRLFAEHLNPGGALVISYDAMLDKDGVLLRQYNQTLKQLGLVTSGFVINYPDNPGYLLVAGRPDERAPGKERWRQAQHQLAKDARAVPDRLLTLKDFRPITDDRPYLAGNLRNILSEGDLGAMWQKLTGLIGLAGLVLVLCFRRSLGPGVRPGRQWAFLGLGVLVGANFVLLEYLCAIHLFRYLYIYYDALVIGMVLFLALSGMGSLLIPPQALPWMVWAAVVSALAYPWWSPAAGPMAASLLAPLFLVTGLFFPVLFEKLPRGRLALFAMDAVGAALGGLVAFFVPMLFGLGIFTVVAVATFVCCGLGMVLFLRPAPASLRTNQGEGIS
jgi:spermidine synthase